MTPPLLLGVARLVLLWERLWPRLWPGVGIAALFLALAWFDVLPRLPGWLHALVLGVFAIAFGFVSWRGLRDFGLASEAEARARLERDSALDHHMLTALDDRLAAGRGDPVAETLWATHRRRLLERLPALRLKAPAPGLARHDPRALRAAVLLLLVTGGVVAGDETSMRLGRALSPPLLPPGLPPTVDLWISPPPYTGRPVLHLTPSPRQIFEVPEGSTLMAQVGGLDAAPSLKVGGMVLPSASLGLGSYRVEGVIAGGDSLTLSRGLRELGHWSYRLIPDEPPAVRLAGPPKATERARLRLAYAASDDYGVVRVKTLIRRGGEEFEAILPMAGRRTEVQGVGVLDLTAHPWAGLPVQVVLVAVDAAGKTGRSSPAETVLPERDFRHPLARFLVEQRKRLGDSDPEVRHQVAEALGRLALEPDRYAGDVVVHLALGVGRARLLLDTEDDAVLTVRALLWSTALRLEEGGLGQAEQDLARIADQIRQALEKGDGLDGLSEQLKNSLDQYLSALAQELQRQNLEGLPQVPGTRTVDADFLRRMVDEIAQLARSGNREAAERRLAELQGMLQGLAAQMRTPEGRARLAEAARILGAMKGLAERQKRILDRSYEALRGRKDEFAARRDRPPPDFEELASGQEGLRRELEEMAGKARKLLGELPASMDEADTAMAAAVGALAGRDLEKAVDAEGKALEALRKSQEGLSGMVARREGNMPGLTGAPPGGLQDPFGRQAGQGPGAGSAVDDGMKLPGAADLARSRAILDELRRRAGDPSRPLVERDYIDRLLRRF
ncbi:MAG: DUF4175 domain-containing protein [Magnetospirillum sp. WYHS-4]